MSARERKRISTICRVSVVFIVFAAMLVTASTNASALTSTRFGVMTGNAGTGVDTSHLAADYAAGLRLRTLELSWENAEPTNGSFSGSYFTDKNAELTAYHNAGFGVTLDLGFQYAPSWARSLDANAEYVNQFGDSYEAPQAGKSLANGVFDNSVRTAMAAYVAHVASVLGTNFDSVRVGGGFYGELHYPTGAYNGRTNSFWGYDANAQGSGGNLPPGVSANPVPGWAPDALPNGSFEDGNDGLFNLATGDTLTGSSPHRGSLSLQKVNPGSYSNQTYFGNVPVVAGRSYTMNAWVKSTNAAAPACVQVRDVLDNGLSETCSGSSGWTFISSTFTPPDNNLHVALLSSGSASTTLGFDDVSIFPTGYGYEASNTSAQAFYDWYLASLANYQNWQISTFRTAGFANKLYAVYPSYGIRHGTVNQAAEAISYGLSQTRPPSVNQTISEGTDWPVLAAALPSDNRIDLYSTWVDGPPGGSEASSDAQEWSPLKYLASIAAANGRSISGENVGATSAATMTTTFARIAANNLSDLYWYSESQLYGGVYASINDYQAAIISINGSTASSTVSVTIDPAFTFTVGSHTGACNGVAQTAGVASSANAVGLGHISPATNVVGAQDLTVSTNAGVGYVVFITSAGGLSDGNGHTIAAVSGTNAVPGIFPAAGTAAFGYTTSDSTLATISNDRFTNPSARWAQLSATPSEVSSNATPILNDAICVAYQVGVSATTPAATYSSTVIYTAVPTF